MSRQGEKAEKQRDSSLGLGSSSGKINAPILPLDKLRVPAPAAAKKKSKLRTAAAKPAAFLQGIVSRGKSKNGDGEDGPPKPAFLAQIAGKAKAKRRQW